MHKGMEVLTLKQTGHSRLGFGANIFIKGIFWVFLSVHFYCLSVNHNAQWGVLTNVFIC